MVHAQAGDACAHIKRGITIAEAIIREFPLSATLNAEMRGNTFAATLMRSFYLLLGKAMIMVFSLLFFGGVIGLTDKGRRMTNSESAFPLQEFKDLADKVLQNLRDNPISLPPPFAIPGAPLELITGFRFHSHFGSYHYAGAYMLCVPPVPTKVLIILDSVIIVRGKQKSTPLITE